jgi:hypothetical protein
MNDFASRSICGVTGGARDSVPRSPQSSPSRVPPSSLPVMLDVDDVPRIVDVAST